MLNRQINRILLNDPFFGSMLLNLELKHDPKLDSDMATDGKYIFYNNTYVKSATPSNIRTTLIHELLHCVLLHIVRIGDRQPKAWNVACDYAVNAYIKDKTDYDLTSDFLFESAYREMSAEQIYEKLMKEKSSEDIDKLFEQVKNSGGEMLAPSKKSTDEIEISLEEQWKANVVTAQNTAKSRGYDTANLEELLEEILNPTLPWHIILMDLLQEQSTNDYSWSRPNMNFVGEGVYLPSAYSESAAELVIGIDTSCSVGENELAIIQAELNGILEVIRPKNMTVIHCDTDIKKVEEYDPQDLPVRIKFAGRGGTKFQPVFKYIEDNIDEVKCLVFFTDLWSDFDDINPSYPLFWVNTEGSKSAPVGTTLHVNN